MSLEQEQAPKVTVRDAIESDVPAILKMHAQSWLDTYPNEDAGVSHEWVKAKVGKWDSDENIERRRDFIRRCKGDPNVMYKVAENDDGGIVGIIAPFRNEETQRVGAIYVDKAYYGSGLAQQLMDEIITWSDRSRPLELEVASYNERAKSFYRKYGFKEVQGSEHLAYETLPVITMIRKGDKQ